MAGTSNRPGTALRDRVWPEIGGAKLAAVTTSDLQELVDRWLADGWSAGTVRNTVKPLQAIYRRAKARDGLPVNPTRDLELPAQRSEEVEIVSPETARRLLDAAPKRDRPIWATALYAGLRYGELRALRWRNLDLGGGTIAVVESWDDRQGPIRPKTRTSRRTVPVPAPLREILLDRKLQVEPESDDLVFAADTDSGKPFAANTIYRRADKAWQAAGIEDRLRLASGPPHLRVVHDRGRGQREGPVGVHGALLDHGHVRPVRTPNARVGRRGRRPPRGVPGTGGHDGETRRDRLRGSP